MANPQTLNLYAMVRDNPETFADIDGHCPGINPSCDEAGVMPDRNRFPCINNPLTNTFCSTTAAVLVGAVSDDSSDVFLTSRGLQVVYVLGSSA